MTTIDRTLARDPLTVAATRSQDTARRRLGLAVLWLAGLVGWGLFSYDAQPPDQEQAAGPAAAAERVLDGRGKWVGY